MRLFPFCDVANTPVLGARPCPFPAHQLALANDSQPPASAAEVR